MTLNLVYKFVGCTIAVDSDQLVRKKPKTRAPPRAFQWSHEGVRHTKSVRWTEEFFKKAVEWRKVMMGQNVCKKKFHDVCSQYASMKKEERWMYKEFILVCFLFVFPIETSTIRTLCTHHHIISNEKSMVGPSTEAKSFERKKRPHDCDRPAVKRTKHCHPPTGIDGEEEEAVEDAAEAAQRKAAVVIQTMVRGGLVRRMHSKRKAGVSSNVEWKWEEDSEKADLEPLFEVEDFSQISIFDGESDDEEEEKSFDEGEEEEKFVDEDRGEDGGNDEEGKEREHRAARMDPGSTTLEKTKQYASVQQSSLEEGVSDNGKGSKEEDRPAFSSTEQFKATCLDSMEDFRTLAKKPGRVPQKHITGAWEYWAVFEFLLAVPTVVYNVADQYVRNARMMSAMELACLVGAVGLLFVPRARTPSGRALKTWMAVPSAASIMNGLAASHSLRLLGYGVVAPLMLRAPAPFAAVFLGGEVAWLWHSGWHLRYVGLAAIDLYAMLTVYAASSRRRREHSGSLLAQKVVLNHVLLLLSIAWGGAVLFGKYCK